MVICGSGCGSWLFQVFYTITIDPLVGVTSDKRLEGAATYGFERISKRCDTVL